MKTFMQFLREAVVTQLIPMPNPGDRKYRLFAVACCHMIWDRITDKISRTVVEVAERFADGQAGLEELHESRLAADHAYFNVAHTTAWYEANAAAYNAADYEADHAASLAADHAFLVDESVEPKQEELKHCIYIEHPFAFEDLSGNVKNMARRIYEKRDWSYAAMSILADALDEAGCDDPHVFHHCREHKEHARGCWVVDHILGRN